jgi:hypothetical protein
MADRSENPTTVNTDIAVEQSDRRIDVRIQANLDVEIEEPKARAKVHGRVTDLGLGGCYIDVMSVFPVETVVRVRIRRDDQELQTEAAVVYSKQGLGMGLAFKGLAEEQRSRLLRWTGELSADSSIVADREVKLPSTAAEMTGKAPESGALQQLIRILSRKGIITHSEFEQLLRELKKQDPAE